MSHVSTSQCVVRRRRVVTSPPCARALKRAHNYCVAFGLLPSVARSKFEEHSLFFIQLYVVYISYQQPCGIDGGGAGMLEVCLSVTHTRPSNGARITIDDDTVDI